jgi:hypothetical protein
MYGLKSSGAAWHAQLISITLRDMGFEPTMSEPDVWLTAASKSDGFQYYEYILVYVDDILAISHQPVIIVNTIKKAYHLKEGPAIFCDKKSVVTNSTMPTSQLKKKHNSIA